MPMAAIPLVMGGVSAIAGAFGKKQQTQTTPTYSNTQTQVQNMAGADILSQLQNPSQAIDQMHNTAIGDVNQNYSGIEARMKRSLTGTGFGKSGKMAAGTQALEIARSGELGGLESKFAGMQLDQNNKMLSLANQFGFAGGGQTTTGTGGGGLGGAVGAGSETASMLFALNHLLSGGGTPYDGSSLINGGDNTPDTSL